MIKLLKGDFIRLFKSKIFWLGVIFMFGFASVAVYTKWDDLRNYPDYYNPPDGILLAGTLYISIVIAVFIGTFIGTDYSNGTIRNKHIIGHSRTKMYLSNMIVCVTASVIIHLVYIAVIVGAASVGITRKFEMSVGSVASQIIISIISVVAISAILLFVSMLISSRSAGVVTAIILSILMILAASMIDNALREVEYFDPGYTIIAAEDGSFVPVQQDPVENPNYLTGTKRKVFEFINDVLPVNQICQMVFGKPTEISETNEENNVNSFLPLYSLALTAVMTTVGVLIFRKKDLK